MTGIEDLLNSPGCPREVIADWYTEHGMDGQEFLVRPPWIWLDVWRFMRLQFGLEFGSGRGRKSGFGFGRGSQIGIKTLTEKYMRIGKNYIVHLGNWNTFVGRCTEQLGPLTYAFADASKISNTNNGDNWHLLAAGNKQARAAATYLHCETEVIVPLSIAAIEWVGELPGRKMK